MVPCPKGTLWAWLCRLGCVVFLSVGTGCMFSSVCVCVCVWCVCVCDDVGMIHVWCVVNTTICCI